MRQKVEIYQVIEANAPIQTHKKNDQDKKEKKFVGARFGSKKQGMEGDKKKFTKSADVIREKVVGPTTLCGKTIQFLDKKKIS